MSGTSAYTFSPDSYVTRGSLVTILGKVFIMRGGKVPERKSKSFPDVPDGKYYTKYVEWAKIAGMISGNEKGEFLPDGAVTREQLAVILMRTSEAFWMKSKQGDVKLLDEFGDRESCSRWAEEGLAWACANGLIAGVDGDLKPRNQATRAEVAQMIYRFTGNK